MSTPYVHKRGASFVQRVAISADFADGYFVGWTPTSRLTLGNTTVADFTVEWVDPVTTRELRLSCKDTSAWPIGSPGFDIRFVRDSDGFVIMTKTFIFPVEEQRTDA